MPGFFALLALGDRFFGRRSGWLRNQAQIPATLTLSNVQIGEYRMQPEK
jgi:hypothetical protein